jgi:hypothetical protein
MDASIMIGPQSAGQDVCNGTIWSTCGDVEFGSD